MIKIKEITITDENGNENVRRFADEEILKNDLSNRLYTYLLGKILDNGKIELPGHECCPDLQVSVKLVSSDPSEEEYCFDGSYEKDLKDIRFRERTSGETPQEFFQREPATREDSDASEWYSGKYDRYLTVFRDYLEKRGDLSENTKIPGEDTFYACIREFVRTKADGMGAVFRNYSFADPACDNSDLRMRSFIYLNRFWNYVGRIRDYGYREKPVVIPVKDTADAAHVSSVISSMRPEQVIYITAEE